MIRRLVGIGTAAVAGASLVVAGIAMWSAGAALVTAGLFVLAGVVGYLRGGAA